MRPTMCFLAASDNAIFAGRVEIKQLLDECCAMCARVSSLWKEHDVPIPTIPSPTTQTVLRVVSRSAIADRAV